MDQPQATANGGATEFVATTGGHDTVDAQGLLVTAYVLMWALVLGFIALSWRRQGRLEGRITELEKALAERDPQG